MATDDGIRVEVAAGFCRGRFTAMASDCEILAEIADADAAFELTRTAAAEAWRIECKYSRYRRGSLIDRINSAAGEPVAVDAETAQLFDFAREMHELSDGRFDITSGALRRAWVFDGSARVPAPETVRDILTHVGWERVTWDSPWIVLPAGMEIDLGGIGKEYAVDRICNRLRAAADASCLVNLGGDLAVTRAPAGFDAWRIGIDEGGLGLPSSRLRLRTGALATSGDAHRFLEKDDRRFSHILDPHTGWPVEDAPHAVTVAADTCVEAGMLATLAMLEGRGAEAFLAAHPVVHRVIREPCAGSRAGPVSGRESVEK